MSERERELEWEREREREREREQAARGYPASGRITPKNEAGYARSQHGSNAPSPAFGRPPVYGRDDARDYYNNGHPGSVPGGPRGGYERGPPPGMRHDERGPPPPHFEHERGHLPPPPPAGEGRYDGYGEGHDGPMGGAPARPPPPPGLRGPTPEWERARGGEHGPPSIHDGAEGRTAGGAAAKPRRGPKSKDEHEAVPAPPSPAPSAAGKKGKATGSRASSPWSAKSGAAAKNGRSGTGAAGGKKGVSTPLRSRDDQPDSRPGSPMGGARAQRDASPASSDGSNEPLAARAPSSRMVDEDYDEGAADALMGLAGAASASASAAPAASSERGHSPDKRAESSLGKRPFAEEEKAANGPEDSYKRAKNGNATATAGDAEPTAGGSNGVSAPVKPESVAEREEAGDSASRTEAAPQATAGGTPPPKSPSPKPNSAAKSTTQPMDEDPREPSKGPSSEAASAPKDSPSTAEAPKAPTPAPAPASAAASAPAQSQAVNSNKNDNKPAATTNNNSNDDDDSREDEEGQIHEDDTEAPSKAGGDEQK